MTITASLVREGERAPVPGEGGACLFVEDAIGTINLSFYAFVFGALYGTIAKARGFDVKFLTFAALDFAQDRQLAPWAIGALLGASMLAMVVAGFTPGTLDGYSVI